MRLFNPWYFLVVLGGILLLGSPAFAQDNNRAALQAILETEFQDVTPLDNTQSLLRQLLWDGFAHTPSVSRQVNIALDSIPFEIREQSFLDKIERVGLEYRWAQYNLEHYETELLSKQFDIPLHDHPLVDMYIEYFTGRGRWFFAKWLARLKRYRPIMEPILKEEGLPADTVFLAMIESGFSAKAYSSAKAAGFWQFIPSTGRIFKLKQNFWLDERRDFIIATRAACRFLKQLYSHFENWHLAWASYNAGAGRIGRALKKYNETDFWNLIDNHPRSLAKETRHYVPKLIAAAIVAKNADRYNFPEVEPLEPLTWDEIEIKGAVDIRRVAKKLGAKPSDLRTLNPAILRDITPPQRTTTFRVPKGQGEFAQTWIAKLPRKKRFDYIPHKIKRGDTLYGIASQYGTTMRAIKDFNRIKKPRSLRPGKILLIPSSAKAKRPKKKRMVTKRSKKKNRNTNSSGPQTIATHIVSSGETLWSIAQRYQVTVTELKKWNGRRGNQIRVGERLHIF